jgi:hypothetical protein
MESQQNNKPSPLEAEIDNKISMAYLYSIAAKTQSFQISQLFKERYDQIPITYQSTNSKPNTK